MPAAGEAAAERNMRGLRVATARSGCQGASVEWLDTCEIQVGELTVHVECVTVSTLVGSYRLGNAEMLCPNTS